MARRRHARPRSPLPRGTVTSALLLAATVLVGGNLTSNALLTDNAAVGGNAFTSGTLDIATDKTTLFNVPSIKPGDAITAPLTLTNSGTTSLRYAMTSATTENTLAKALVLTVKMRSPADNTCTAFDGTVLYSGDLGATNGIKVLGDQASGAQVGDRVITTAAPTDPLCFQVLLPTASSNTASNLNTTATLTISAEQTDNNGPLTVAGPPVYADIATFADPFADPLDQNNTNWWPWTKDDWSGTTVANGQLHTAASTRYDGLVSRQQYNWRNGAAVIELVQPPPLANYTTAAYFGVRDSGGGGAEIAWDSGNIYTRIQANSTATVTQTSRPYDPVAHRWLRLRETASTVFYDFSADGQSWTTAWSTPTNFDASAVNVNIGAGSWGTNANPGDATWDNFNMR